MITIAARVEELIERWPLLRQGLELDLLNTSAVARYLKPELEKAMGEKVSEAAVLMAIRRYEARASTTTITQPQEYLGDITVRSDLADFTYTNSSTLQRGLGRLANDVPSHSYLTISRGLMQTSIIFHTDQVNTIKTHLTGEHLEKKIHGLASITLQLKERHAPVPGIVAYPLQLLTWKGVSVVEFISTYDELNIILRSEHVESAFSTLNQALRTQMGED